MPRKKTDIKIWGPFSTAIVIGIVIFGIVKENGWHKRKYLREGNSDFFGKVIF